MSLLGEPTDAPTGTGRWVLLVVLVGLVAGAAYLLVWPSGGPRELEGTDDVNEMAATGEAPEAARLAESPSEARPVAPADDANAVPEPEPARDPTSSSSPSVPNAALPPVVLLRVTSDIEGADVFIDRRFVGQTPFESSDVAPGPHRVNVSAPGYEGFTEAIEIGDDLTTLDVAFRTIRLDQRVAVVHDHRFGDCTGYLVATIDGLRYETDHDDQFSVGLDALEEFAVDYLEHNLRLKVRGGRTYNFTDDEPNADKLFVFHREVEKARDRLAEEGQ